MIIKDGLQSADGEIASFLLIGQSNMAGRGDIGDVPPIVNENCLMLRMGRWQKMSEPINPDRAIFSGKFRSGVSLAASFADALAKESGGRVGLIPCADGGTRIEQWQPGEVLFDHAVMMARLAMRTSRLAGILWHQGESNATKDADVAVYREGLVRMMCAMRKELGAEEIPFLIGELSDKISDAWKIRPRVPQMNAIFSSIAAEFPQTAVVSAEGLALRADGIHFTAASLREFGLRYFEAYRGMVEKKS